jgi:hypothetical protein
MNERGELINRIKHERKMTRLSVISLVLVIAVVFAALIIAMFNTGLLELPPFIQEIFVKDAGDASPGLPDDIKLLYDALNNGGDEIIIAHDITGEDVEKAIASTPVIDSYTAEIRTTVFSGNDRLVRLIKLQKKGEKYRAEIFDADSKLEKVIICDGERVYISADQSAKNGVLYNVGENFTMEDTVGIPGTDYIRRLIAQSVGKADYSMASSGLESLYLAEYALDEHYTEKAYFSLRYGLVVRLESEDDLNPAYRMIVEKIAESETQDELFVIPMQSYGY